MEENEYQPIHVEPAKYDFNFHVLWLFVPAIVFILVMTFIVRATPEHQAAIDNAPPVLGEEAHEE